MNVNVSRSLHPLRVRYAAPALAWLREFWAWWSGVPTGAVTGGASASGTRPAGPPPESAGLGSLDPHAIASGKRFHCSVLLSRKLVFVAIIAPPIR